MPVNRFSLALTPVPAFNPRKSLDITRTNKDRRGDAWYIAKLATYAPNWESHLEDNVLLTEILYKLDKAVEQQRYLKNIKD